MCMYIIMYFIGVQDSRYKPFEPAGLIGRPRYMPFCQQLPSGKHLHNDGKSPFLMVKSTINGHVQ